MRGTTPRLRPRLKKLNEYTNIRTKNKLNYIKSGMEEGRKCAAKLQETRGLPSLNP